MTFLAASAFSSFVMALALIYLLRPLCFRFSHVDRPGGRKRHLNSIPLSGGIAISISLLTVGLLFDSSVRFEGFVLGLMLLASLGAFDDRRHVPATVRLAIQTAAVTLGMCALGNVVLRDLGNLVGTGHLYLASWSVAFTVFSAVGIINAINMIDGIDGLAAGFTVLILAGLFFFAFDNHSVDLLLLSVSLGSVSGFLLMNIRLPWRPRAAAFLGDAGSLVLGFILSWFLIRASQGGASVIRPITAVWFLGLPLMDTCYLMSARVMRGKSPFAADRYHFHHLLLRSGVGPGRTLCVWLGIAASFVLVGSFGEFFQVPEPIMLAGFLLVFVIFCTAVTLLWRRRGSTGGAPRHRALGR